jgi:hypothetical protein
VGCGKYKKTGRLQVQKLIFSSFKIASYKL